ncbi:MAG: Rid family hydrolase [Verrucomicrobia bacterium]|nr:Rid family hydrolase [Verrucomicrobiota bacterium]
MVPTQPADPPTSRSCHAEPGAGGPLVNGPVYSTGPCRLIVPAPCGIPTPCGLPCDLNPGPERHAILELGNLARLALIALPGRRGSFAQQAEELFAQVVCILGRQPTLLAATTLMVFLRDASDEAACRQIVQAWFGAAPPVTTFVAQPPCNGAALGVELWAVGGTGVTVSRFGPDLLTVESEGIRWIHCGGIRSPEGGADGPHAEALSAFTEMERRLARAGVIFGQVVRTWLYVNQITQGEDGRQRYQELNRARSDFYAKFHFGQKARTLSTAGMIYPASTGIGTNGPHMEMACLALDSDRPDVFLVPLENPQQTPAYEYRAGYSPRPPKFSRAMAAVQGHFVSTLVSGTASIVNSRTCHPGDILRQTEQTLENIERLIAPENFARHGLPAAGATLSDIAKLRVYVKHPEDYEACREVCERRLPRVPAIYLRADICRPDLLVEIEAVAFSPVHSNSQKPGFNGLPPGQPSIPTEKLRHE